MPTTSPVVQSFSNARVSRCMNREDGRDGDQANPFRKLAAKDAIPSAFTGKDLRRFPLRGGGWLNWPIS